MTGTTIDQRTESRFVTFDAVRLGRLTAEVEKLNKVARKLGVDEVAFEVVERHSEKRYAGYGTAGRITYEVEVVTVALTGESPRLAGGWRYVGSIEHLAGLAYEANIVHGDDPVLAKYRTADPACDHCNLKRDRGRTIIVRADDGRVAQVGTACMKDFLGYHGDPERVVAFADSIAELADDMEDSDGGGRTFDVDIPTHVFLTATAAAVRTHGWVPKSAERGLPTATLVTFLLGLGRPLRVEVEIQEMIDEVKFTDADEAEGKAVKAWAATIPADTDNNYLGNVRTALAGEHLLARHFGIAASAIAARRKAEEGEQKKAEAEGRRAVSKFVGTVGKRQDFEVEVKFVRAFDNEYGTSYLVIMEDAEGNAIKTFSSGAFGRNAEQGQRGTLKATVKAHEVYNGNNVTMVTRVKAGADWTEETR